MITIKPSKNMYGVSSGKPRVNSTLVIRRNDAYVTAAVSEFIQIAKRTFSFIEPAFIQEISES
jgi:hypothetical protein